LRCINTPNSFDFESYSSLENPNSPLGLHFRSLTNFLPSYRDFVIKTMINSISATSISILYILLASVTFGIQAATNGRETLDIIIGGGGSTGGSGKDCDGEFHNLSNTVRCALPNIPLVPSPLPLVGDLLDFLDQRLALVYPVIQNFKSIITSD